jgi:putative ABC transport system substrate-binding protein
MNRRGFLALTSITIMAMPRAACAQQAMPVIGFLQATSRDVMTELIRGFHQGIKETGHVEGDNVAIEYRFADNQLDRLPALADDLIRRKVNVIVAGSPPPVFAAKMATTTIPIVFGVPEDPVRLGLVASLAHPGGNLTGINFFSTEIVQKRLELLRQMLPAATRIAVLLNPANVTITEAILRDLQPAARTMALQVRIFNADTNREIDAAFEVIGRERFDALFVSSGPYFNARRVQIAQWAARVALPATYGSRLAAEVGGLMSYSSNRADSYRQMGIYAGRILKGAKPESLPVAQENKFELVINAQTARMLGLTIPQALLVSADEVIE